MNYGTMPAGKYWIGDLCYVMHPQWDEVCGLVIKEHVCIEGMFTLANGVEFAMFNTAYGDGNYEDREGRVYPVDSGSIGCIRVDDIEDPEAWMLGGNVVEFDVDFNVSKEYGSELVFGNVVIDTDPPYEPEYDEEEEDAY